MVWGERNHVIIDNAKEEFLAFTRPGKAELRRKLAEAKIPVRGHTLGFNTEATQ